MPGHDEFGSCARVFQWAPVKLRMAEGSMEPRENLRLP
jgi:hypothetical protein